jgi:hypothetical protein
MIVDLLNGFAGLNGEGGSQRRMAIDERLKGALESRDIYLGANASRETDIVDRVFRRELVQEPDPLLIVGEGMKRLRPFRLFPQKLTQQRALFIG